MKGKDLHPRLLYPAKLLFRMEGQIKCFPDKINLKEFTITKPLLYEMLKGLNLTKRRSKTVNSKMTTKSQLSTTEPKNQPTNKQKLSQQLEQEENHRNGDHMEGHQQERREWGERYRE